MFVEKQGMPSVAVPEESRSSKLPYVFTDIVTCFTVLVGIYFPSVTGEATGTPVGQAGSSLSSNVANPIPPVPPPRFLSCLAQERSCSLLPICSEWGAQEACGFRQLCPARS